VLEACVPGFEFSALLEGALPKTSDHLVGEELHKVLLVGVLAEGVFEELGDWHVVHAIVDVCSFRFIIGVVNQLEEYFFVLQVEI